MSELHWPALSKARAHDPAARLPFFIGDARVGSVARCHLDALAGCAALAIDTQRVCLVEPAASRDAAWSALNRRLRDEGRISGWRDESFSVFAADGIEVLAVIERAAARFWGTLTWGAHATGYVADASGKPSHLWIARRALSKSTDPGRLDNLIGGGVPHGQARFDALLREGWEEAGLDAGIVSQATPGSAIELLREIPEGLQHELVQAWDLALPAGLQPVNQDGEVAAFLCLPVDEGLALAASGEMTVDAELVTLDFALRHGLVDKPARWQPALDALRPRPPGRVAIL